MPTSLPKKVQGDFHRHSQALPSQQGLLEATLFVAAVFSLLTAGLPAPFVLPALSLVIVVCGLLLGASALAMNRLCGFRHARIMEVAGVLVLFGFAAAIVCDEADALLFLTGRSGI